MEIKKVDLLAKKFAKPLRFRLYFDIVAPWSLNLDSDQGRPHKTLLRMKALKTSKNGPSNP